MKIKFHQITIVSSLAVVLISCAGKLQPPKRMKVGQTISLKPVNPLTTKPFVPKHFLLFFDAGGIDLDFSKPATVGMYKGEFDANPVYEYTTTELMKMHTTTKCESALAEYLDNATNADALFCNNSLNLGKVNYFVLKRPGKRDKTATSINGNFEDRARDLAALSIIFY